MRATETQSDCPAVLIVAEVPEHHGAVCKTLVAEGFRPLAVTPAGATDEMLRASAPVAILLMQSRSALQIEPVVRKLRRLASAAAVPLIVLGSDDESDELVAFAMGADDFISPPVSPKLLAARIVAQSRRGHEVTGKRGVLRSGNLTVDQQRREVTVAGTRIPLTPTEYTLLCEILRAAGRVVTRARLAEVTFGERLAPTDRRLDVHMAGLRRKLGVCMINLNTIRGVGYAWRMPESVDSTERPTSRSQRR